MRYPATIALLLLICTKTFAQTVTNVESHQQEDKIKITYSLDKKADISAFYSTDNGQEYTKMAHVFGDVGRQVAPGRNKSMTWHVLSDVDELSGENITFKIEPSGYESSKWRKYSDNLDPYWMISAQVGFTATSKVTFESVTESVRPAFMYGVRVGWVKKFGAYLQAMYSEPSLSDNKLGVGHKSVSAGGIAHLGFGLFAYAGLGYGWSQYLYSGIYDNSDSPYGPENRHGSFNRKYAVVDAGIMGRWDSVTVNAGVTMSCSKNIITTFNIGVGYSFNTK